MPSNIGNQIVSLKFFDPANTSDVNKRFQGIRPVGIYSGGYLTVSGANVDLSPLVCEISDGDDQVRVETTVAVNKSVPYADNKPYIVLRWLYTGATSDYMEILVVATPAANDVVVGKCTYTVGGVLNGVIYSERTTPDTLDLFLKVEPGSVSKSIRVRQGRKYVGTAVQEIDEQYTPISLSSYSAGNVVYIYVNDAGGLTHSKTASDYDGKLLLAKVVIPNPFNSISVDDITDIRSFLMDPVIPDGTTIEKNITSGKLQVKDSSITNVKLVSPFTERNIPRYSVKIASQNNYTIPSQFVSPIAQFSWVTFGTLQFVLGQAYSLGFSDNSFLFKMTVNSVGSQMKTLKLFSVDNWVYIYINGSLAYSRITSYSNDNSPLTVNLNFINGENLVQIVWADQGSYWGLSLVGDLVDGVNVLFVP